MKALKLKTLALVALLLLTPLHAFAQTAEEALKKGNKAAYQQGQNTEAIEALEKGYWAYGKGQKTEAIQYYTQAIQLNPQYALAYSNRGATKSGLGDQTGAMRDYNTAIRLNPKYADAYCNRGIVKAQSGDKRGAFVDLEKAKQLFVEQGNMEAYKNAIEIQKKVSDQFARKGQ
jgi:tetratricopeptide (TPR) repeat protein